MESLTFEGKPIRIAPGETVLAALLAAGVELPNSCRAGVCQTCLVQAIDGNPPAAAQQGLPDALKAQGYLMAAGRAAAYRPRRRNVGTRTGASAVAMSDFVSCVPGTKRVFFQFALDAPMARSAITRSPVIPKRTPFSNCISVCCQEDG